MLTILLLLPLAGALLATGLGLRSGSSAARQSQIVSLLASLLTLGTMLCVFSRFDFGVTSDQFIERVSWIPGLGISYSLGLDGFRLFLGLLTALLVPIALLTPRPKVAEESCYFPALILALQTSLFGAIFANDLVLFYVFWELMLIPVYFLIGIFGEGEGRRHATIKFVIYTVVGSLLMLSGIIALGLKYAAANSGNFSFGIQELIMNTPLSQADQILFFCLFSLAFLIKVPAFPLHTWLPDAYVAAPNGVTLLLSGVMAKLGLYGLIRIAIPLFPAGADTFSSVLAALGAFGIVYGAMLAWAQTDLKRLLAYSSMSHLGFCLLGIGAWNNLSLSAASFQIFSHGLLVAAVFYFLGHFEERFGRRNISSFGGLAKQMPKAAVFFFIFTLSSIGLPLTMGFVGEFFVLQGSFLRFPWVSSFAVLGIIFGALYMLTAYQRIFFGPPATEEILVPDFGKKELSILFPLVVVVFALGIFPNTLLQPLQGSVARTLYVTEQRAEALLAIEESKAFHPKREKKSLAQQDQQRAETPHVPMKGNP